MIQKEPKSWLDYRPNEPTWIQVAKFKPLDGFDLEKLCELCKKDGIIDSEKLKQAYLNDKNKKTFTETQIDEYAKQLEKLDLLLFDTITTTEELLNNPISDAIVKDIEPDIALLTKIADVFWRHTQSRAVQKVIEYSAVFNDYDCIANTITEILQKQESENQNEPINSCLLLCRYQT